MAGQKSEGLGELPGPRARDRIVECDDEAGRGGGTEAPLDQLPWLEIVGQRDRAEIVAERGAGAGRDCEHGGDAGHDDDIERPPGVRAGFDRLQHRGRHGEHAGVAARDDGDICPCCRVAQRGLGARAFLAVVGTMTRLAFPHWNPVEIGCVAVKRLGGFKRVARLLREVARIARAEPNDGKPSAHGRPSQPGTSTMAK
jgi:hypothetical protein